MRATKFPWLVLLLSSALSACAGATLGPTTRAGGGESFAGLECAPFARALSGIALYGEAAAWWDAAADRYPRARTPIVGGVLVFRRADRLPSGHVSVVSAVLGPREILVTQANWVPRELDEDQPVVDVSENNDWSAVRVWYPPVGQLGAHSYETYGFILPPVPVTHEALARASRQAAILALSTR